LANKSLLKREEITLLRRKYLPAIHREYKDTVDSLNAFSEPVKRIKGDELYLTDSDQRRLFIRVARNMLELDSAVDDMKQYLVVIAKRLGVTREDLGI